MVLTLTLWQSKRGSRPTKAGEGRLLDPSVEAFDAAVSELLGTVEATATPFQIVAQVGASSRGIQFVEGWTDVHIKTELWTRYQGLTAVNG